MTFYSDNSIFKNRSSYNISEERESIYFFDSKLNNSTNYFLPRIHSNILNLQYLEAKYSELRRLKRVERGLKPSTKYKKLLGNYLLKEIKKRFSKPSDFFKITTKHLEFLDKRSNKPNQEVKKLSFKQTDLSYFTPKFLEIISQILPHPRLFDKLNFTTKHKVRSLLLQFMDVENEWKTLATKTAYNVSFLRIAYRTPIAEFIKLIEKPFFLKNRLSPSTRIRSFYLGLISVLKEKRLFKNEKNIFNLFQTKNSTFYSDLESNLEEDFIQTLELNTIFTEIIKITLQKSYETSVLNVEENSDLIRSTISEFKKIKIDSKSDTYDFDLLVKGTDLKYEMYNWFPKHLIDHFINILFNVYISKYKMSSVLCLKKDEIYNRLLFSKNQILDYLQNDFVHKNPYAKITLKETKWFYDLEQVVHFLYFNLKKVKSFIIFTTVKFVNSEKNLNTRNSLRKQYSKSFEVLLVSKKCDVTQRSTTHIPDVVSLWDLFRFSRNNPLKKRTNRYKFVRSRKPNIAVKWSTAKSSDFIKTLLYTSSKNLKVNNTYCDVLIERMENNSQDSTIVTNEAFKLIREKDKNFQTQGWSYKVFSYISFLVMSYVSRSNLVKKDISDRIKENYHILKLPSLYFIQATVKKHIKREFTVVKSKFQLLKTYLNIASVYTGYTLFYPSYCDYRGRIYPLFPALSRVSGFMKFSLCDSKPTNLTCDGMFYLLYVLYNDKSCIKEMQALLKLKKTASPKITDFLVFFKENSINVRDRSPYIETIYKLLNCFHEQYLLDKFTKPKKSDQFYYPTSLILEVDQNNSGPTIIALLLGNKRLAEYCRLTSVDKFEGVGLYEYILSQTRRFITQEDKTLKNMVTKDPSLKKCIELLSKDRSLTKNVLMCFLYNEKHLERMKKFKESFEKTYSVSISETQYSFLIKFAINYEKFIDFLFPDLSEQLTIINEFIRELVNLGETILITTLDGVSFKWNFMESYSTVRTYTDLLNKTSNPRLKIKRYRKPEGEKVPSEVVNKSIISFRPNLIHSIDGWLIRLIVKKMRDKCKYNIVHVHDCIHCHPNYIEPLFEIIKEIFVDIKWDKLLESVLFKPYLEHSEKIIRDLAMKYFSKFKEKRQLFTISKESFNPRNCYSIEKL